MVDMTKTTTEKLTPSDIRGVFLRSNLFESGTSNVCKRWKYQLLPMVPAIRRRIGEV